MIFIRLLVCMSEEYILTAEQRYLCPLRLSGIPSFIRSGETVSEFLFGIISCNDIEVAPFIADDVFYIEIIA